ncbi:histidine kinase transcriptional regulator protein [Polaribacter butkevichii]|uniref:Histidine kinase transcriptional regulator protein n=1 Tax=Polaribacter butkevichii TaxID=218490 RepID=A0A2P6CFG1_9FLAO|nr:histidine kinase transcriptional regulator protein [Polaribacter butkevichii]
MQSPENSIIILFISILITLGVFLVLLFVIFLKRKNRLVQDNLENALKNQQQQHELELKALRGQMNPHFVHNSLNAIQYYIQQNDVETSENYLAKFSKLMRQFFDYSRRKSISLSEEISLLENYLQIEKLRFEEKLVYEIKVDAKLDIEEECMPPMILQPLVENAINHGLFHKQGNGKVSVQFKYIDKNCFKVAVIDNGIGLEKAKKLNNSIKNKKSSHSSAVLLERLHFLNESSHWNVSYKIIDRSVKPGKTGTEVSLLFNQKNNEND